jgi:HD-GYP domain-containing protein (c-di-GMP phosphodiesterase class II)
MHLVQVLSKSLDLVVDGANMHQWRTAAICKLISDELGAPNHQQPLLNAALLHDIGAPPDLSEREKLLSPDAEQLVGRGIFEHAENGRLLLEATPCFRHIATAVRHHHDRWDGGNPSGLQGDAVPLESRILHLADRIDACINRVGPALGQRDAVYSRIVSGRGKQFDPEVVDAFIRCSRRDSFWLDIVHSEFVLAALERMRWEPASFSLDDLLSVAGLFATLIDRKSAFTATHSRSVAKVAVFLAGHQGFCRHERYMMQLSGLLHDIGKLSVPGHILEKPGPLTPQEMNVMRQHPFFTYRLLEQISGMREAARWAGLHHETPDGEGYPFRMKGEALPLGSRIMAVADVFAALAEDRPYRNRLEGDAVTKIMRDMADRRKIDGRIAGTLFDLYREADDIVLSFKEGAPAGEARAAC